MHKTKSEKFDAFLASSKATDNAQAAHKLHCLVYNGLLNKPGKASDVEKRIFQNRLKHDHSQATGRNWKNSISETASKKNHCGFQRFCGHREEDPALGLQPHAYSGPPHLLMGGNDGVHPQNSPHVSKTNKLETSSGSLQNTAVTTEQRYLISTEAFVSE